MRINSSPGFSGNLLQVNPGELANTLPAVKNLNNSDTGIQFGSAVSRASDFANDAGQVISDSSSSLASLYEAAFASNDVEAPDEPEASSVSPTSATVPVESTQASDASDAANAPKASDAAFLDDSRYSGADSLQRWAPMVAHLPAGERAQAATELNRPIAAAWMAREKGENPAKAMESITANPALNTAVDTAQGGGNADGKITNQDLKTFAKSMGKAADNSD
ncbi:type III effector HrpK domain-containing protein, partial [Pseudomonas syringae]|uniref:type III effector HrpK domain-containing protein n=1 Tax=Pseudomonas syringae TaxID=317 RepID=UPI0027E3BB36